MGFITSQPQIRKIQKSNYKMGLLCIVIEAQMRFNEPSIDSHLRFDKRFIESHLRFNGSANAH